MFDLSLSDVVVFWVLAGTADMCTFTILYRVMFKRWWWHKSQSFDVWWNEKGWGLEGSGNPFDTIFKMVDALMKQERDAKK